MSKKLTKKQLKTTKGGSGTTTLERAKSHVVVPAIDAPIAPIPHVKPVVVVTEPKLEKKLSKPGDEFIVKVR